MKDIKNYSDLKVDTTVETKNIINKIKVTGGVQLKGEVTPVPNKNAMMACLPAATLSDEDMIYKDLAETTDVERMLAIMKMLGATINKTNERNTVINCSTLKTFKVDKEIGMKYRSSIMLAGPLLARFGIAEVPLPGGCLLGQRSIAAHIDSFKKAGIEVEYFDNDSYVRFKAPYDISSEYCIWQSEASVTATENLAMYCAGTNSQFEIIDAACEPHVRQLLLMLRTMGANIHGIGTNRVSIKGKRILKSAIFEPEPDHVDIAGFIVAAAMTKSQIRIKNSNFPYSIDGMVQIFEKFNIRINREGSDLIVDGQDHLHINVNTSGFPLASADLPKLVPRPWPGFPVDVLPVMIPLATKMKGKLLVQNWIYENGLELIHSLNTMGSNIFMSDPQKVVVFGPTSYRGGNVTSPPIIQSAKAIFLAALSEKVETTINNVGILRRRYPKIFEIYQSLGANIEILE